MAGNLIGVMQGRLLPKYKGRYQAHPVDYWQDEFELAAKLGLDLIEWIFDFNDVEKNPLYSEKGTTKLQSVIHQTGVRVQTICADYFMEAPLHSGDERVAATSKQILKGLLEKCPTLGITDVVIPCVDQSRISSSHDWQRLVTSLRELSTSATKVGVFLSLEADLAPTQFVKLLNEIDSPQIKVNYDTGNSASLGFRPMEELEAYGSSISDIHIKDRMLGGGSVILGQGHTDFKEFFECLAPLNYSGPFIMQAYRDDEGLEVFKNQLDWAKNMLRHWKYIS